MTLYEMATTHRPQWGDGRSDPALLTQEVTLEPALFDPELREAMLAFFEKALRRDVKARFDNADDMLASWRRIFTGVAVSRAELVEAVDNSGEAPDFSLMAAR